MKAGKKQENTHQLKACQARGHDLENMQIDLPSHFRLENGNQLGREEEKSCLSLCLRINVENY
jgi:hypothetical protein